MPVAGPASPTTTTPPRHPTTCRRTSSVDIVWQRADERGVVLRLSGHARDVRGRAVLDEAEVDADVDAEWGVVDLRTRPRVETASLLGASIRAGFRGRAAAVHGGDGTPVGQLLDDLPVAALIAGYATMREVQRKGVRFEAPGVVDRMRDLCSGWRAGGGLLTSVETGGGVPLQPLVVAPDLRHPDDPEGWHALAPLPPLGMRRVRRVDVDLDATEPSLARVDAMFRDSYGEPDGTETVLHEYGVTATADLSRGTIRAIEASPHVLPWEECPAAARNVGDLIDVPLADVRAAVPAMLAGVRGCTHLNDLLRSLDAVARLGAVATATK